MQGLTKCGDVSLTSVTCQFPEPKLVFKLLASLHYSSPCGPELTSRGQTQPVAASPILQTDCPRALRVPSLHCLNCPFSFSGFSFALPQTQSTQVIRKWSHLENLPSLRSPNHPNSQVISPPLTRTPEVPDKRTESLKLGCKSCSRHRSFSRRSRC